MSCTYQRNNHVSRRGLEQQVGACREHEMAFLEFMNLHHTIDVHFAFSEAYLLDTDTRTWSEALAMLGEHAAAACGVVNVSESGGTK